MDGNIKTGRREVIDGFPMISWTEDDGLTLVMVVTVPETGATLTATTHWTTLKLALMNYEPAKASTIKNLKKRLEEGAPEDFNNTAVRKVTRFGTFYFTVLAGPPTWKLPHADLRLPFWRGKGGYTVMVGWIRRAFVVSFDPRRKERDGQAQGD